LNQYCNCQAASLFALLKSTGFAVDVPIHEAKELGEKCKHPYIAPSELLEALEHKAVAFSLTGTNSLRECQRLLVDFWVRFGTLYPNHQAYKLAKERGFIRSIPLLLHGDEGTTHKKQSVMVLSYGGALGRGTRKARRTISKAKAHITKSKGGINMWGHSLGTRFVFTAIHKKHYATITGDASLNLQPFLELWTQQMLQLQNEGFVVDGARYFGITIGTKGDWPYLHKSGRLTRTFYNIPKSHTAKNESTGICHLCGAGMQGVPFEHVCCDHPPWEGTVGAPGAFKDRPAFLALPHDPAFPAAFWRQDIWHGWHLGLGKYWVAGVCVLVNDHIAPGSSVKTRFAWMTTMFREWASDNKISLHVNELSSKTLCWAKRKDVPVASWSKGAQTTFVCLWLEHLLYSTENLQYVNSNKQLRLAVS
jgi:hypothetical protein